MELANKTSYEFTFQSLVEFEELTGKSPFTLEGKDFTSPKLLLSLAWCGLKNRPDKIEDLGKVFNIKYLEPVTTAFMRDMGAAEEKEKGKPEA